MCAPKRKSWSQVFLAETVETRAKYRDVIYNIFKRSWPFSERVGPRILSLESVDYFTAGVSGRRKKESLWAKLQGNFDGEANWSVVVKTFILCKSVLWWACDCLSRWLKWCPMFITFLLFNNDVISLETRPLNFVFYIRLLNQFTNKSSNTK